LPGAFEVKCSPAVGTGAPGEGEEAVQRSGPGGHQAAAAAQSHPGAADQRERHGENTSGAPGRKGETTDPLRRVHTSELIVLVCASLFDTISVFKEESVELKEGTSV